MTQIASNVSSNILTDCKLETERQEHVAKGKNWFTRGWYSLTWALSKNGDVKSRAERAAVRALKTAAERVRGEELLSLDRSGSSKLRTSDQLTMDQEDRDAAYRDYYKALAERVFYLKLTDCDDDVIETAAKLIYPDLKLSNNQTANSKLIRDKENEDLPHAEQEKLQIALTKETNHIQDLQNQVVKELKGHRSDNLELKNLEIQHLYENSPELKKIQNIFSRMNYNKKENDNLDEKFKTKVIEQLGRDEIKKRINELETLDAIDKERSSLDIFWRKHAVIEQRITTKRNEYNKHEGNKNIFKPGAELKEQTKKFADYDNRSEKLLNELIELTTKREKLKNEIINVNTKLNELHAKIDNSSLNMRHNQDASKPSYAEQARFLRKFINEENIDAAPQDFTNKKNSASSEIIETEDTQKTDNEISNHKKEPHWKETASNVLNILFRRKHVSLKTIGEEQAQETTKPLPLNPDSNSLIEEEDTKNAEPEIALLKKQKDKDIATVFEKAETQQNANQFVEETLSPQSLNKNNSQSIEVQ